MESLRGKLGNESLARMEQLLKEGFSQEQVSTNINTNTWVEQGVEQHRKRVFVPESNIRFSSLGNPLIPAFKIVFSLSYIKAERNFFLLLFVEFLFSS